MKIASSCTISRTGIGTVRLASRLQPDERPTGQALRGGQRGPSTQERKTAKKAPPDYSRLDAVQVWPIGGARSRNHKKMANDLVDGKRTNPRAYDPAVHTFSGPSTNIGSRKPLGQVPSGNKAVRPS